MVLKEPRAISSMAPSHSHSQPHLPYRQQPRPALRPPQRYDGGGDDRQVQQAGRSATNLNAQASAQSLRVASRPSSRDRTQHSPLHSPLDNTDSHLLPADLPPPPPLRQPRYSLPRTASAPAAPNSIPPSQSSNKENRRQKDQRTRQLAPSGPQRSRTLITTAADESIPDTTTTQSLLRPPEITHADSTASLGRLHSPRSVRDLGSDYTRYFNPFATPTSSEQDLPSTSPENTVLMTQLHPNAAVPAKELANRLSNPFKDEQRVSNPFESVENIAPPTPQPAQPQEEERTSSLEIVAIPPLPPPRTGTPAFISKADPEKTPFYPWVDDRFGAPWDFTLYIDQQEDDDEAHMPRPDDDKRYRTHWRERFSRDNIVNTIGAILLLAGLATIFIVLPIVSYTGVNLIPYMYETPMDQMGYAEEPWAHVNDLDYPLIRNMRTGLIDPDTPDSAKRKTGVDGDELVLVFSDEFNARNRTFYSGDDPYWTAPDMWYGATADLEWYDPDAANTGDGVLSFQLDAFNNHGLGYRSGMLNSWNQICFKGGVFEVSMSLPGPGGVHGLWPGAWTMGNLGRPGYLATTDGVWPYTYDSCDVGITPNQSSPDGISFLPGQRLSSCTCYGEDHPSHGTGRGAPEIDIAEISADWAGLHVGVATQSFQVAPFDIFYYPNYDFMENPNYATSLVNTWTGGPYQQAVSTTTFLNNDWYDGKQYQKYSFEYVPGGTKDSFVAWFVGDEETMRFDARAIGPNGNVKQRLISEEPMSMILNLGISHNWVDIDTANLKFPTIMRIDYVRWYQKEGEEMVTCDPPGYETTNYIARHPEAYNNVNLTHWSEAGYSWPKNSLMHGCST